MNPGTTRKIVLSFAAAVIIVLAGLLTDYVALPLFATVASARIPQSCVDTRWRRARSPIVLADDGRAKLVLMGKTLLAIRKSDAAVIRTLNLDSTIVAATLHDGTAYVFGNAAIGFFFDETTGAPIRSLIETDNYREPWVSHGATYVQTDFEMSAIHPDWSIVSHLRLNFRTVAYGCILR